MNLDWTIRAWAGLLAAAGAWSAPAQTPPAAESAERPVLILTLGSPLLRSTADRMNASWLVPGKLPDFRLRVERPDWNAVSVTGLESRIRGFEVQLPLNGVWVGYELPVADELPRATFSIQRGF